VIYWSLFRRLYCRGLEGVLYFCVVWFWKGQPYFFHSFCCLNILYISINCLVDNSIVSSSKKLGVCIVLILANTVRVARATGAVLCLFSTVLCLLFLLSYIILYSWNLYFDLLGAEQRGKEQKREEFFLSILRLGASAIDISFGSYWTLSVWFFLGYSSWELLFTYCFQYFLFVVACSNLQKCDQVGAYWLCWVVGSLLLSVG